MKLNCKNDYKFIGLRILGGDLNITDLTVSEDMTVSGKLVKEQQNNRNNSC